MHWSIRPTPLARWARVFRPISCDGAERSSRKRRARLPRVAPERDDRGVRRGAQERREPRLITRRFPPKLRRQAALTPPEHPHILRRELTRDSWLSTTRRY